MSDTYRMGAWDCSDCGKTGIKGFERTCPRCKSPQNSVLTPSEDWYLPDDAGQINDPAELAKAAAGSVWNCGYCETANEGDAKACSKCGRPLDFDDTVNRKIDYDNLADRFDDKPDPRDEMIESDLDRADRAIRTHASGPRVMKDLVLRDSDLPTEGPDTAFFDDIREKAETRYEERLRLGTLPVWQQKLYPHRKLILIASAVIVTVLLISGVVGIVRYYTSTMPGTVTVSELHWNRSVEVEEFKTLTLSDWGYPSDARIQGNETRIRTYRTVHDGWHTEQYTDYETRYRSESYTDNETRYRSESYTYDCSYQQGSGNGSYRTVSRSCSGTRQVPYTVPVQKTRQVSYQVPVQKTRQVEDTHQEPVYDTWYTYQVDRWVTDRWVGASDATSDKVIWPEVTDLHQDSAPGVQVGEEKVGNERKADYTIVYTDSNGKQDSIRSDKDELWSKLTKGESIPAQYYQHGGGLSSVDWNSVLKTVA